MLSPRRAIKLRKSRISKKRRLRQLLYLFLNPILNPPRWVAGRRCNNSTSLQELRHKITDFQNVPEQLWSSKEYLQGHWSAQFLHGHRSPFQIRHFPNSVRSQRLRYSVGTLEIRSLDDKPNMWSSSGRSGWCDKSPCNKKFIIRDTGVFQPGTKSREVIFGRKSWPKMVCTAFTPLPKVVESWKSKLRGSFFKEHLPIMSKKS